MTRILLTGATGRVGTAVLKRLGAAGNRFALVGRNAGTLAGQAQRLDPLGIESHAIEADLSERSAPRAVVDQAVAAMGGLDILVNNAAGFGFTPFADADEDRIDRLVDLNLRAVLHLTRAALEPLSRSPRSAIVNIASTAGLAPVPEAAVYSATKAAIIAFGDAFRNEAEALGVALCTIVPGQLRLTDDPAAPGIPPESVAAAVASIVEAPSPIEAPARIVIDR